MENRDYLSLAALLHDIGKFRKRATDPKKPHQDHSYEFVNEDFADFFEPCGDTFQNAILNHHTKDTEGCNLIEKQLILADKLSATESEDETEEVTALVPILSRLNHEENENKQHGYTPTTLSFESEAVIPTESAAVDQSTYAGLWKEFRDEFSKATSGKKYSSCLYQTVVALIHKYTSRIPSETSNPADSDISLYDHLRTTAAIAACIGHELTNICDVDDVLDDLEKSERRICALIKGDISGIQDFLYHILSDGAARQLRGRSFYLQLLTEAIAHSLLRQLDLPITNLIFASGGQFYILAPYTKTKQEFDNLRQQVTDKLWSLHRSELYCILDYADVTAVDFRSDNFSNKWGEVSEKVNGRKQKKWSEMGENAMYDNLFEPSENKEKDDHWKFGVLGWQLSRAEYLVAFEVDLDSGISKTPSWRDAIKVFGWDVRLPDASASGLDPNGATRAVVYRLGDTDFLKVVDTHQGEGVSVSYDFRIFHPVIAKKRNRKTADYNYLANASEGVEWLGVLRMDIDDLGVLLVEKLEMATISRLATFSEALRIFFEGYVPQLCRDYNAKQRKDQKGEMLELIYAGGDDLFLVGGWSALPEIARQIRAEFKKFVTGNYVTLSGGIAIEHKKYPLYQFASESGKAEKAAKRHEGKDAISFMRKVMSWTEYDAVRDWHDEFMKAVNARKDQLPRGFLTRLSQIYSEKGLKEHRWAWRSIYYFHSLKERYKSQGSFLHKLKSELNHPKTNFHLQKFIHVITRWTALRIRK